MSFIKPIFSKPYIPPQRFGDNRPISKEIYKTDNSNLINTMISVIKTADPTEIYNFFISNTASNLFDKDGNSPIHLIVMIEHNKLNQQQKIDIIKYLVLPPHNVGIDMLNNSSESALHIAVQKQYEKLVDFLISNGANPDKINYKHQNCLHMALIPNIQTCEKKISPDPIIAPESSSEDKNTLYNQILAIFYNKRNVLDAYVGLINQHIQSITNYYMDQNQMMIELVDDKVISKESPVDIVLKQIQNTILTNITSSTTKTSDIKKNTNYQIIRGISKIMSEYEKFVGQSVSAIDIETRPTLKIDEANPQTILNELLGISISNTTTAKTDVEKFLANIIKQVETNIYDNVDAVLKLLFKTHNIIRKNGGPVPALGAHVPAPAPATHSATSYTVYGLIYGSALYQLPAPPAPPNTTINKTNIVGLYNILTQNTGFISLSNTDAFDQSIISDLNKTVPGLINNLNLWMSLDNINNNRNPPNIYDFSTDAIYQTTTIVVPPVGAPVPVNPPNRILPNFMIVKDERVGALNYKLATNSNQTYSNMAGAIGGVAGALAPQVNNPVGPAPTNILNLNMISNSFNYKQKNADTFNILKRRLINDMVIRMCTGAPPVGPPPAPPVPFNPPLIADLQHIYNRTRILVNDHYSGLDTLATTNIDLETIMILVSILDRIFVNTVKNQIYLNTIGLIKTFIQSDIINRIPKANPDFEAFKNTMLGFIDKIIAKTNSAIKLEKQLNDMVLINNKRNINSIYNRIPIDDLNITKVFDQNPRGAPSDPTQIYREDPMGDYLAFYAKDYNSMSVIAGRKCMYNTTAIIDKLLNIKTTNYYAFDVNGYSPIYYAIESGNYLLIRKLVEKLHQPVGGLHNYPLLRQNNKFGKTPLTYAFEILGSTIQNKPDYQMLNVTFMNNLLLSGEINRNIPSTYYNMYQILLHELNQLIANPRYTFRNLLNANANIFDPTQINTANLAFVSNNLQIFPPLGFINNLSNTIDDINSHILSEKSIYSKMNALQLAKNSINLNQTILDIKNLVEIFESKHKPLRLYKYLDAIKGRPKNIISTDIKEVNKYYLILITMGVMSIRDIIKTYYLEILLKTFYTSNVFNFNTSVHNNLIELQLGEIINLYIESNMFNMVRVFYSVKLDQYDIMTSNQTPIDDFMNNLLDQISQNGIITPESQIYNNIKQYINAHMIELLSKTLQYNQIILDVFHRWLINLYYSIKTFDILSS